MGVLEKKNPCNTTKYESIDADSGCTEYFNRFFFGNNFSVSESKHIFSHEYYNAFQRIVFSFA